MDSELIARLEAHARLHDDLAMHDAEQAQWAADLRAAIARLSGAWVPVAERMPPPGSVVLAAYRNQLGHWRRIRAEWTPAKTQEAHSDQEEVEYDEATDTYYTPEGWYELINNWDDYSSVKVYEGEPSHWMPLPEPPEASNTKHERTAPDEH